MSDFQPMKDLEVVLPKGEVPFATMLNMQRELVETYYTPNLKNLSQSEKVEMTLKLIHAIDDELSELRNQVPWKWWKKPALIDEKELKFEIIDLQKFLMTLMLIWGMDDKEVIGYYIAKYNENVRRQKDGY